MKKTITSVFMVPTLEIPKGQLLEKGFINAYSKDSHREVQYDDCIYLLFNPKDLDDFREFLESEYERTKSVIDDYDYEDGYVVVVYKLNSKFQRDFDLVRSGKYSKTSLAFQKLFPQTVKVKVGKYYKEEMSLQYRVFNKTEDLIKFWEDALGVEFDEDQEIWHGYDEDSETLNLEIVKEKIKEDV